MNHSKYFHQRYHDLSYWRTKYFDDDEHDLLSVISESDLDSSIEFQDETLPDENEPCYLSSDSVSQYEQYTQTIQLIKENKRKRKAKRANNFILDEAEDAFDVEECFYDDKECTQSELNNSIQNFIVDDQDENDKVDSKEYLKSISDMVGLPQHKKFKLKYDYDPDINVYSQAVVQDEEEEYEMDSFCCDEIVYDDSEGSFDCKVNQTPEMKLRSRKILNKNLNDSSSPIVRRNSNKRYKRVIVESP